MSGYNQQIEDLRKQLAKSEIEKSNVIQEKDQAVEDLLNVENAFSDVHKKYERAKGVLENFKKNEDLLKLRDEELTKNIELQAKQIQLSKQTTQSNLETMYHDYESKIQSTEVETMKLRALLRKTEMKINTLENDLEQKHIENVQLSALCDDLINGGVGNS